MLYLNHSEHPFILRGTKWFIPFTPKSAKIKTEEKALNFILQIVKNSTSQQLSFEWSYTHRLNKIYTNKKKNYVCLIDLE